MMVVTAGPASRVVVLGAPGGAAPVVLARGLVCFAPGLLGYGLMALLSRALYAQGDARTPAFATAVGWAVAIVVDIALVTAVPATWAVAAVGIGSSVGLSLAAAWMLLALRHSAGSAALAGAGRSTVAAAAGVVVSVSVGAVVVRALPSRGVPHNLVGVVILAALVGVLHLAVVRALDRPTVALIATRARWRRA